MISIDFECCQGHRFEGCFRDHDAFTDQTERRMVQCPLCMTSDVKRIYRGCSIHSRSSSNDGKATTIFQAMRAMNSYVRSNFDDVGTAFAEKAREIHYGISQVTNVYGQASPGEVKELLDEGIPVLPLIDPDPLEN